MVLRSNDRLLHLRVAGNPICHLPKIREKIIPLSSSLQTLDAQPIAPIQRQFLENLALVKSRRPRKSHHQQYSPYQQNVRRDLQVNPQSGRGRQGRLYGAWHSMTTRTELGEMCLMRVSGCPQVLLAAKCRRIRPVKQNFRQSSLRRIHIGCLHCQLSSPSLGSCRNRKHMPDKS